MKLWPRGFADGKVTPKQFAIDLWHEINKHDVFNYAAAISYYLMFAVFPAILFLLSLVPYLPIPKVDVAVMEFLRQVLPGDSAKMFTGVVEEITHNQKGGLLSLGFIFTLYAAQNGTYSLMQVLNSTYAVQEGRPFWKVRLLSFGLTVALGVLMLAAFGLIVVGGDVQDWLAGPFGRPWLLTTTFSLVRWSIILVAILAAFSMLYYFGPDAEQKFRFITPGSVIGTGLLILATLGFRLYVASFANFSATYGSIGAVIVLMLWFYVGGVVILLGSEINALIEHYSPDGKAKGEKFEGEKTAPTPYPHLRSVPHSSS